MTGPASSPAGRRIRALDSAPGADRRLTGMNGTPPGLQDYARHSGYSDPRSHRALVAAVGTDPDSLHRAATATIAHYRADPVPPSEEQLADIDRRWLDRLLDAAAARADGPLDAPRTAEQRVGGCCRDHSLLAVGVLREHGIPARTRLGFADYFTPGYRHDHVVVERWDPGSRSWRRSDPELEAGSREFDVHAMPAGEGSPFETAAEAWIAYREGRTDLADYGVGPGTGFGGPWIVQNYVIGDLAHRQRTELLLWDGWGEMTEPGEAIGEELAELTDRIARLTVAADAGDDDAERELAERWAADERLRPGRVVETHSPSGRVGRTDLERRETDWA